MPGPDLERLAAVAARLAGIAATREDQPTADVSDVWRPLFDLQSYVFDLSPSQLLRARLHTGLFTRFSPTAFWQFAQRGKDPSDEPEVRHYRHVTEGVGLPDEFRIGEPPLPASPLPTGYLVGGRAVNSDVSRYQACISNLVTTGIWKSVFDRASPVLLEIGSGYGGLADGILSILGERPVTYLLVDVPDMLVLAAGHLTAHRPDAELVLCETPAELTEVAARETPGPRVVLAPFNLNDALETLPALDLIVAMATFQEMNPDQLRHYARALSRVCRGWLYSDNREAHSQNPGLAPLGVTAVLAEHWQLFPDPSVYERWRKRYKGRRMYLARPHGRENEPPPTGALRGLLKDKPIQVALG